MATASSYSSAMGSGDFDPDVVTDAAKTQPVIVPYEEDQRGEFANYEHANSLLQQLEEDDKEHRERQGWIDEVSQTNENVDDDSVVGDEWDQFRPLFSSVVQVTIATQRSVPVSFQVPASLVVMREREMQRDCQELGIGREFWKGSRLGGALRHHWTDQDTQENGGIYGMCQLDHACNIGNHKSTQNMISFTFDPEERDIDSEDASNSIFTWNPVLVKCIESYYESGRIRVPDESLGNDVLLVLEFFGIVYSPQQLVFDSFGCFLRVKLWTDYYSHRATMADWIVHQLITSHSRLSHAFCTCPEALDPKSCLYVGTKRCDPLDGGLFLDNSRSDSDPDPQSCSVVHDFFNDDDGADGVNSEDYSMAALLRQDFCTYVQNSLPGTVVTFSLREVTVIADSSVKRQETWNIVRRAFLHIDFGGQAAKHAIAEPTTVILEKRKDEKDGGTLISALEDEVELSTFQVGLDESKDLVHTMDMLEKSNSPLDYSMESSYLSKLDKEPFDLDSTLDVGVTSSFQDETAAVVTPEKNADKDDSGNADMVVPMTLSEMGHFTFESSSNSPLQSNSVEVYETIEHTDPESTPGNIEVCHVHARSDTGSICTKEDSKNATECILSTTNTTASTQSSHSLEGATREQIHRNSTPTPLKQDVSMLDIEYYIPDKEEEARLLALSIEDHEQQKNTLEGENAAWLRSIFISMVDCWGGAKCDSCTIEERESVCNAIDRAQTMASQEEGDEEISGCSSIHQAEASQEKFDETSDDCNTSTVGSVYGIEVKHKLPNSFPSLSFAQGLSSVPDPSPHKRSDVDNTANPYGLTSTYSL